MPFTDSTHATHFIHENQTVDKQIQTLLLTLYERDLIRRIDKRLTLFLLMQVAESTKINQQERQLLGLIFLALSLNTNMGNVCLNLSKPFHTNFSPEILREFPADILILLKTLSQTTIANVLEKANIALIGQTDHQILIHTTQEAEMPPLIVVDMRLYWQRMWQHENSVANYLIAKSQEQIDVDRTQLRKILDETFSSILSVKHDKTDKNKQIDRQKLAAVISLTKKLSIISGGPGTGKTTTVAAVLLAHLRLSGQHTQSNSNLIIKLAAPTGKAAARLTESLKSAQNRLEMSESERLMLSVEAVTLHRLLGATGNGFRINETNRLQADLLVIDEASMIDLSLMAKLISALKPSTKVILLGDKDQLSSVEPGRVLGDICRFSQLRYLAPFAKEYADILGIEQQDLLAKSAETFHPLSSVICLLIESRRFSADSLIGKLARAINQQDSDRLKVLISKHAVTLNPELIEQSQTAELTFVDLKGHTETDLYARYQQLLDLAVSGYYTYLEKVREFKHCFSKTSNLSELQSASVNILETTAITNAASVNSSNHLIITEKVVAILDAFNHFRVLTSIKKGIFGVAGLNQQIEAVLTHKKLIQKGAQTHYEARPILITENENGLKLFNGDIGITLYDPVHQRMNVYFIDPKGQLKIVAPSRLPNHETAYAMTVHKSQGSEFDHTVLVLPPERNPVLSKELLYTAVTRAKTRLSIFATLEIMDHACMNPTPRNSGLIDQLEAFVSNVC